MPAEDAEDVGRLEAFDAPEREHVCTFETGELSALCPFEFGGPDFYELTLKYEPDDRELESRSLKKFLEGFRSRELTAEHLATEIATAVEDAIAPARIYVRLEQARRGGIEETVEVGDRELR